MKPEPTTTAEDKPPAKGKPRSKKDTDKLIAEARKRFAACADAEKANRQSYKEDVAFSCSNDQWTEEARRLRGKYRPALTFNRLNGVVKHIIGGYRQNRLAIKVRPASGDASEDMAEIMAGLIRNIEAVSNADYAYVNALECSVRGGFGYFRILTDYNDDDVFDQDIRIAAIQNPLTVYLDPAAKEVTREDANFAFVTEYIDKAKFEKLYPDAKPGNLDVLDDEDKRNWMDGDRVRIAEYFCKEPYKATLAQMSDGTVIELDARSLADMQELAAINPDAPTIKRTRELEKTRIVWRKMTGSTILEEKEWAGKYIPIVPVLGEEVNLEGKAVLRSAIYYAKDAQRMLNFFKSAATESVALGQKAGWLLTPDQLQGNEAFWDNNSVPMPYKLWTPDGQVPPQPIPPVSQPIGEITMALQSGDDIKATTNIFDASLGNAGNETSGKAIMARQTQGDTSTFIFIDNMGRAIEYAGRILIDLIPKIYDAERTVRVIGVEGESELVTVNEQQHDRVKAITHVLNDLTLGKYDVEVSAGPSFMTRRVEAVNGMMEFIRSMPQQGALIADELIKNMDWPGAEAMSKRLKRALPPQITVDPDSEEGKQMAEQQANQPPPVPPEVQQQQAEAERKRQESQQQMQMKDQQFRSTAALKQQQFEADERRKDKELAANMSLAEQKFEYEKDLAMRESAFRLNEQHNDAALEIAKHGIKADADVNSHAIKTHADLHAHALETQADLHKHAITADVDRHRDMNSGASRQHKGSAE